MKVSCTHFQCASWAFEYLRDHFGCAAMSLDMSHEVLTFQVSLMLVCTLNIQNVNLYFPRLQSSNIFSCIFCIQISPRSLLLYLFHGFWYSNPNFFIAINMFYWCLSIWDDRCLCVSFLPLMCPNCADEMGNIVDPDHILHKAVGPDTWDHYG